MENRIELPETYDEINQSLADSRNNPEQYQLIIDSLFEDLYANFDHESSSSHRIALSVEQAYTKFAETPDKEPVKNAVCTTISSTITNLINDSGGRARTFRINGLMKKEKMEEKTSGSYKPGTGHTGVVYSLGDGTYIVQTEPGQKAIIKAESMIEAVEKGVAQLPFAVSNGMIEISDEKGEEVVYTKFALGEMVPLENNPDPNSLLNMRAPFEMSDSVRDSRDARRFSLSLTYNDASASMIDIVSEGGKRFSLNLSTDSSMKYGKSEEFGVYQTKTVSAAIGTQYDFKKGSSLAVDVTGRYNNIDTNDNDTNKAQHVKYNVFSGNQRLMLQTPELLKSGNGKKSLRGFAMEEFGTYGVYSDAELKMYGKDAETYYGKTVFSSGHLSLVEGIDAQRKGENTTLSIKAYVGERLQQSPQLLEQHKFNMPKPALVAGAEESLEFDLPAPGASTKLTVSASGAKSEDYMLLDGYSSAEARVKRGNTEAYGYGGYGVTSTMLKGDKEPYVEVVPFMGAGVRQDISKKTRIDTGISKTGFGITNGWNVGGGLTVGF